MNEPRKPNNLFDARAILLTIIKLGVKNPSPLPTMGCGVEHLISTAVLYPGDIDRIVDMMRDQ